MISGFALGLSLIVAFGAQNAFVLRQGLRQEYVFVVVLICVLSEAVLVAVGVGGIQVIADSMARLEPVIRWGGFAFLVAYGALSLWKAVTRNGTLDPMPDGAQPLPAIAATCLALTWLNPHVYLDTVFLLGSISTHYAHPYAFGVGAVLASLVFFSALGYGARIFAPIFRKPVSWRVLDVIVALMMWGVAASLLWT